MHDDLHHDLKTLADIVAVSLSTLPFAHVSVSDVALFLSAAWTAIRIGEWLAVKIKAWFK